MTIGKKISLNAGVSLALIVATGGISFLKISLLERTIHQLATNSLPAINSIGRLNGLAKDIRGNLRGHITATSLDEKVKAEADLAKLEQDVKGEIAEYEKTISSAEERGLFVKIPEGFNKMLQTAVGIQPLSREAKSQEAMELFRSGTMPAFLEVQKAIDEVVAFERQQGSHNAANAADSARSGKA